jgi:hypothetical protein
MVVRVAATLFGLQYAVRHSSFETRTARRQASPPRLCLLA